MQATLQNLKLITIAACSSFFSCFSRLAFSVCMQRNNVPKIFLTFFHVHIKHVKVSAKVCAHLCILPIAGYPR